MIYIKKRYVLFSIFAILFLLSFQKNHTQNLYFDIPKGFPKPIYDFKTNPLTKEGFELGRKLFYDPILSKDHTISCASCHLQQTAFAHVDHDLSHGIEGKIGNRNALTLQNLAWNQNFMWDGGINHLDVQGIAPITNPVEMDETMEHVVFKLNQNSTYKRLFWQVFKKNTITSKLLLHSLSQYLVALTTSNSKFDRVVLQNKEVFTVMEKKGYELFNQHCASCHPAPLFFVNQFKNNGLPIDATLNDLGRYQITQNPKDSLLFKVPTLRNIAFSFPYMHDGRFKTLTEVVKHYNSGIVHHKTLSSELLQPMNLNNNQRVELVAFLKTLTDSTFLFNKKYAYPRAQ